MDATTARLVDFALGMRHAQLPEDALLSAKRSFIDSCGCLIAAFNEPLAKATRQAARRQAGSTPAAAVWGCDWTSSAEMAAFANSTGVRLLDVSDTYRTLGSGHPSDLIAAIVAAGEAAGASGSEVLRAIIAAYEVYCGCCDAVNIIGLGWDQPVYGVVAATLGTGMLLDLDRDQLGHAVSMALVSSMALRQTRQGQLSNWKNCAGPNAGRNAIFAVLLAKDGVTGPEAIFEGKGGLFELLGRFEWDLPATRGEPHRITQVLFKRFPLCYYGQASTYAAVQLHARIAGAQIESIEAEVNQPSFDLMAGDKSKWTPGTRETADHSLPYVVALGLHEGDITDESFDAAHLQSPALAELMRKVKVTVAEDLTQRFPASSGARLHVTLKDGGTLHAEIKSSPGHSDNPFTLKELLSKFRQLAAGRCNADAAESFLLELLELERAADIRKVMGRFPRVA